MNLVDLLEPRSVLIERGSPTAALLKQAQNAGMTFGCEAEFYLSGVHELFKKSITNSAEKDEHDRLVKPLRDFSYYDVQLFCHALRVPPKDAALENSVVIKRRIASTYKRMVDDERVAPAQMWEDIVDRFGPCGAMMLCGLFPSNGFTVSDTENNYLRQEFNLFLAQPSRIALNDAQENDHLSICMIGKHDRESSLYNLDSNGFGREAVMDQVAGLISKYLGEQVVVSLDPDANQTTSAGYTKWLLTTDGSLKHDDAINTIGLELISPKVLLATGYNHVRKLFDLINDFGDLTGVKTLKAFTADNTGFHMNLGLPKKKIDYVKLLTLIGDDYLIKKFGRTRNANTLPTFRDMVRRFKTIDVSMPVLISSFESVVPIDQDDINYIMNALSQSVVKNKFQSVNLSKLDQHGYVEFRALGNKDYTMRIEDVEQALTTFATMMYAATDPNIYRKEYLSKIYKIVKSTADSTGDPVPGRVGADKAIVTIIKDSIYNNPFVSILERKDREVSKRWSTVSEYLKQYQKTGRINSYAFRQASNNLLTSIRIAYAEGRLTMGAQDQRSLQALILAIRKVSEAIKSSK